MDSSKMILSFWVPVTSYELKGTPSANRALLRAVLRENPMSRPYFLEIALALGGWAPTFPNVVASLCRTTKLVHPQQSLNNPLIIHQSFILLTSTSRDFSHFCAAVSFTKGSSSSSSLWLVSSFLGTSFHQQTTWKSFHGLPMKVHCCWKKHAFVWHGNTMSDSFMG